MLVGTYLLVLGDREALGWVLRTCRMAFPARARHEVTALEVGDDLLIYSTRSCFGNPTRDRGRVVGHARVTSPVASLAAPVTFGGRGFARGCDLEILRLAPLGSGPELAPLVSGLDVFSDAPGAWSARLRRPLVALGERDAGLIRDALEPVAAPPSPDVINRYARWFDAGGAPKATKLSQDRSRPVLRSAPDSPRGSAPGMRR